MCQDFRRGHPVNRRYLTRIADLGRPAGIAAQKHDIDHRPAVVRHKRLAFDIFDRVLDLDALEVLETRLEIARTLALAAVGLLSMGIALFAPPRYMGWAGWCYALISVVEFFAGWARGARRARFASGAAAR